MSKQTNQLQRIIRNLYVELGAAGATVRESVELHERASGAAREIDVLAEVAVFREQLRIAIEVRDREQPADVTWIDELVGKFRDLEVHKVVAISASGFTKAAASKASSHSITTLSAADAEQHDWPQEFVRLGAARLTRADRPRVTLLTDPPAATGLHPGLAVSREDGSSAGTLASLVVQAIERHRLNINSLLAKDAPSVFRTLADLEKNLLTEATLTPAEPVHTEVGGHKVRILSVRVEMLSTHQVVKVPMRHVQVAADLVSAAEFRSSDDSSVELFAIQQGEKPGNVTVRSETRPGR